jgi:hypothetical protein
MPQESPDLPSAIRAIMEPLDAEIDRARQVVAEDRRFLQEKRSRGLDPETKALFEEAAKSPDAPDSLRKLAQQVERGELTWDDVFRGRGGELGTAFLADAFSTARQHYEDADLAPVAVPEEALATGIDPTAVQEDLDRTLEEARLEHDLVWRELLE